MPVFLRRILAFCAMALVAAGCARAADYPSHPVRVLVGYAPGGTTDFSGRLIAQALSAQLKQPFVVENMVGASGTKAAEEVVHSAPDGYALYVADSTFSMLPWVYGQLKWKPESDLKLAAMIMQAPAVLVVAPGSPFKSVREIIEHARQHPDQLSYGSAGVGTSVHLYAELFQQQAKIKLVHREFNGSGEAVKAVQSGKVDLMFTALPSALKSLKEG
ncbi:MAG TPA: tripartite tricarboxylate transporter substrate-binding protein, partial [Methylibium sp.]